MLADRVRMGSRGKKKISGNKILLGTLYFTSSYVKQLNPTKPFNNNGDYVGNIPVAPTVGTLVAIGDTDNDDAYKIRWVEVYDNGKKYLVCDRVIMAGGTINGVYTTNELISPKTITIDGKQYIQRLLSGGGSPRDGLTGTHHWTGGTNPLDNEWDRWICNEGNIEGLSSPIASDLDSRKDVTDLNNEHNQFWNWFDMYSFCSETDAINISNQTMRGNDSAQNWRSFSKSRGVNAIGFRPVLEVI